VSRPPTPATPPRDEVAELREELTALRMQLSERRDEPQKNVDRFSINVYVPAHANLIPFDGTTESTANDVIEYVMATLRLPADGARNCSLVRPGIQFDRHSNLADSGLQDGETVFFVIEVEERSAREPRENVTPSQVPLFAGGASLPKLSPQRTFAPNPPPNPPPTPPPIRPGNARHETAALATENSASRIAPTMLKLKELAAVAAKDQNLASIFLTFLNVDMASKSMEAFTAYAHSMQLNGFSRPLERPNARGTEVFLQSKPDVLAAALEGVIERSRAWRFRDPRMALEAELAEGYIPVVLSGFRSVDQENGSSAFEVCCSENPGGDVWFYFTNNYAFGAPLVRWIDERA
jgi:hypothetical protein